MLLSFSVQADEPSCADYLELTKSKPNHLKFSSCERTKDAQLRVLKATFTVAGKNAETVETELIKNFKMPSLRFVCCGWETSGRYGSFVYEGYDLSVRMASGESLIQQREDWSKIPEFYVTVTLYLDEP